MVLKDLGFSSDYDTDVDVYWGLYENTPSSPEPRSVTLIAPLSESFQNHLSLFLTQEGNMWPFANRDPENHPPERRQRRDIGLQTQTTMCLNLNVSASIVLHETSIISSPPLPPVYCTL